MRKTVLALCLITILMPATVLTAYGTKMDGNVSLTVGGTICLDQDYVLTGELYLDKDTVLDLNGHSLIGSIWKEPMINGDGIEIIIDVQPEIFVAKGATLIIKNGTLDTVGITVAGTLAEARGLTVVDGISAFTVEENGAVGKIEGCQVDVLSHAVENGGRIEWIDNCEMTTQKWTAVHNNRTKGARIDEITNCRFIGYDAERGSGLGANDGNSIGTVKDSVLIGYGMGGIGMGGVIDSVEGCTIISLRFASTPYDWGCAVSYFGISDMDCWDGSKLSFKDCTMIGEKYACGVSPYSAPEGLEIPEGTKTNWFTVEVFPQMVDCTFLPLKKVKDLLPYMKWEMEETLEEVIRPQVPAAETESPVSINISGKSVNFTDTMGKPFIDSNNRTQVPVRVVLEAYGCNVSWDSSRRVAIVEKNGIKVEVPVGKKSISVNGVSVATDTEALIKEGRTYLPIRPVLEAFGASVNWNGTNNAVIVE